MIKNVKEASLITAAGVCVTGYFGAYYLLLDPILAGPPGHYVRFEMDINPVTRCQAPQNTSLRYFFWPAHRLDVLVRHGFWFPT